MAEQENIIDVGSDKKFPSRELSNFAPHEFDIDGIHCASMEGFLQSLKFPDPDKQKSICGLVGFYAKKAGTEQNWQKHQILYWRGKRIVRRSKEYQTLLDRAYLAMLNNKDFRIALRASGNATLIHTVGKMKEGETVLTIREFIHRLNWCRLLLNKMDAETLFTFAGKMITEQKPLDDVSAQILEENFWSLV